jgi:hypothetical protein
MITAKNMQMSSHLNCLKSVSEETRCLIVVPGVMTDMTVYKVM